MTREEATNILFIWDVGDRLRNYLIDRLSQVPNINLIFPSDVSHESLIGSAAEADVIVGWRPRKELLRSAENLKLFINPGAGVQHLIDLFREVNRSRRVFLANCHGNSYFVAQHAVALLLSLTNKVIPHHNWMVAGRWRKRDEDAKSIPLRDRHIGLLGYGAINRMVHQFLSGFDLDFSILRKEWTGESRKLPTPARRYEYSDLHDFLSAVDTLIVAVPLTSLTQDLVETEELQLLGSDGLLVNVSRGRVIDEESLFYALRDELIAGAAIDVWYDYDPSPDEEGRKYPFSFPFHTLENVILSPHRAASPLDDLRRWDEVIENIRRFAVGHKQLINIVDLTEGY